jgi:hypothetical protein
MAFPVFGHPYMYAAMPVVYGQVHPHSIPGTVTIFLSTPLPPSLSSIVLVPPTVPVPSPEPSEDTCSSVAGSVPLTVLIERNVFKQWLDQNIPESVAKFPRLKRYKSVETFMHWITAKKKQWDVPITILIRMTEVRNLLSELRKEFSSSVISQKILRNIFAYEHLFSLNGGSTECGKSTLRNSEDGVNVSHCLEDACRSALNNTTTTHS